MTDKKESINYYKVLQIKTDATQEEVRAAYRKLVLLYHPDRHPNEKEKYSILFELVTDAYDTLKVPEKRRAHDNFIKAVGPSTTSYEDMKKQATEFHEFQDKSKDPNFKPTKDSIKTLKDWREINDRHGYNEELAKEKAPTQQNAVKSFGQLVAMRKAQEAEIKPESIFKDGQKFDDVTFNSMWDAKNKKQWEIMPHSGNPSAWDPSTFASGPMPFGATASPLDNNNLYAEGSDGTLYSSVDFGKNQQITLTPEEISNIGKADYVKGHNTKMTKEEIKKKMSERETVTTKIEGMNYNEFETSDDMGGYGIFQQLGFSMTDAKKWDNDSVKDKYSKMLQERSAPPPVAKPN